MEFTHYNLGQRRGGEVVEVVLSGAEANVKLMDDMNFRAYRAGEAHRYFGGHATRSPIRLQVPSSGNWHVTVDLGGYAGTVQSSIKILGG